MRSQITRHPVCAVFPPAAPKRWSMNSECVSCLLELVVARGIAFILIILRSIGYGDIAVFVDDVVLCTVSGQRSGADGKGSRCGAIELDCASGGETGRRSIVYQGVASSAEVTVPSLCIILLMIGFGRPPSCQTYAMPSMENAQTVRSAPVASTAMSTSPGTFPNYTPRILTGDHSAISLGSYLGSPSSFLSCLRKPSGGKTKRHKSSPYPTTTLAPHISSPPLL